MFCLVLPHENDVYSRGRRFAIKFKIGYVKTHMKFLVYVSKFLSREDKVLMTFNRMQLVGPVSDLRLKFKPRLLQSLPASLTSQPVLNLYSITMSIDSIRWVPVHHVEVPFQYRSLNQFLFFCTIYTTVAIVAAQSLALTYDCGPEFKSRCWQSG